jgi:hypothetical protein
MHSRAPRLAFVVGCVFVLLPAALAGQEITGSIRGRVTAQEGTRVGNIQVIAQSAALTIHHETTTSTEGDYLLALLPPGEYVITFSRTDLVTVKRTTRVSAFETVMADVTVIMAKPADDDAIMVVTDREAFPEIPALSQNYKRTTLEDLPVSGGAFSAVALSSGAPRWDDALVAFDGAPIRFVSNGRERPVLDPYGNALEETTIITTGVPATAGHVGSGLIGIVTRPGGDRLSGSVGATFTNADMHADVVHLARATDGLSAHAHYQIGVPLDGRRTWLFLAGRNLSEAVTSRGRLATTNFPTDTGERLWEAKITHALSEGHRVQGLLVNGRRDVENVVPADASIEDTSALAERSERHRILSADYSGVWGKALVAARVTGERSSSGAVGPGGTTILARTRVRDRQTGALIGAPGTCAECDASEWTNATWRVSGDYLFGASASTHRLTVGYEGSRGDVSPPPAHPGGTFELVASRFVVRDGRVFPVLEANGSTEIIWRPRVNSDRTHTDQAFFLSDEWRRGTDLTVLAGARWEQGRVRAVEGGQAVVAQGGLSPRVSVSWSPAWALGWTLTSGYARYAGDLLRNSGGLLAAPAERRFRYLGPSLNTSSALEEPDIVVGRALNWLFTNGGVARRPSFVWQPGVTVVSSGDDGAPHASELTVGARRPALGNTMFQGHFTSRWTEFPEWRVNPARVATDTLGTAVNQATAVAGDMRRQRWSGIALQVDHRLGVQADLAARYTLSWMSGTDRHADLQNDPARALVFAFPEYVDVTWAAPSGALEEDRRHRLAFWGTADLLVGESLGVLGIGLLHTVESGHPYAPASWVDVSEFVSNPGYLQPPGAVPYYFTEPDAFRARAISRTDLGAHYTRLLPFTVRSEIVVQFHILNVFDRQRVLDPQSFVVINTAFTDPTRFERFDPFVQTPERGVHWDLDPRVSDAVESVPMTMPRAYRLSVGVRF